LEEKQRVILFRGVHVAIAFFCQCVTLRAYNETEKKRNLLARLSMKAC